MSRLIVAVGLFLTLLTTGTASRAAAARENGAPSTRSASLTLTASSSSSARADGAATSPPVAGTLITVGSRRAQRMQGFGASAAWVGNDLVHFPRSVRRQLGRLLFGRRGISLSGFRYNVGGGGVGVTKPARAPETFLTASGAYRWSADPGGRALLSLAQHYHVPELTAFVNSAPSRWTTNGKNCGGALRSDPASMTGYAQYLATIVRHFRVADGITFSYVSPMNEPDNSFGTCGQEGMAVPVDQRAPLVRDVGQALAARAPWAHVIADESATSTVQLVGEAPHWLLSNGTSRWLAAIATHGYDFPAPDSLGPVRQLGRQVAKPVWTTEICCNDGHGGLTGFGPRYDPNMSGAMWMADAIWQDLAVADESAFYWWAAASPSLGCDPARRPTCTTSVNSQGWDDGLVYYDPHYAVDHDYRLSTTKRFYVMGNFSRYVRPGARRRPTSGDPVGVRTLAFSRGRRWSVIVIDDRARGVGTTRLRVRLPLAARATGAVVTSPSENLSPVGGVQRGGGSGRTFQTSVHPQSVTTLTFVAR